MVEFPGWFVTIVGLLAPWLVQLIKLRVDSKLARFWIAVGITTACAVVVCLITGRYAEADMVSAIIWTFTAAQVSFKAWWKPLFKEFFSSGE